MEIFLVIFLIALYFLPTIIAWGKDIVMQVFFLNLFLGWTFIGWVIALVWSFKKENPTQIHVHNTVSSDAKTNSEDVYAALEKLSQLHKNGIITDAEFADQKRRLLNK